jgi:D-alanyl-D-alanine carboxypeptidase/D-alanyl-D-alanine-endopeptidase (penicillin-binding protein 4)
MSLRALITLGTAALVAVGAHVSFVRAADPARVERLPEPVAQALKRAGLPAAGLSVYAHEIGAPEPILAFDADIPRNPASVIKVLTTLVGLEELGPAYQWKTEAYATAGIGDGRLAGDLYLKGYGDPFLVVEHFWRFLRELRGDGVETIAGDLVIDQSYFAPENGDAADFDEQPTRAYNVLPAALLLNFQAVRFQLLPQSNRVRITADPLPAHVRIDNRIALAHESCREGPRNVGMQVIEREAGVRVLFTGRYDATCGQYEFFRVVSEPTTFIHGVFKTLWAEQGGRLDGGVRLGAVPDNARRLHVMRSPPLADIVRSINKFSNNVMTRQLLLTLGAERRGAPGTTQKGIEAVRAWLARRGLEFPELVLDNGSGLSREERISARHLGEVLRVGYASPYMPELLSSLPIATMDGTLKRRFGGSPLEGRVHLKTGSLNGVRSLAGYLLDREGRRVVVVALHNHAQLNTFAAEQVQDALLEWLYARPATMP